MRLIALVIAFFMAAGNLQAQLPTKSETVSYLEKRVKETLGHQVKWKEGSSNFIIDATFYVGSSSSVSTYKNGLNNYTHGSKGNWWYSHSFNFMPEHISSVAEASGNVDPGSPVGFIAVNFTNNLVIKDSRYWYHDNSIYTSEYNYYNKISEKGNVSVLYLPYLKQDATAFERIKKALMHLKDLSVKNDPFAN